MSRALFQALALLSFATTCLPVNAVDGKRLRLMGGLGASSLTGPGGSGLGSGPSLGVSYALNERFGVGTNFTQTFAFSNSFTPFFSRFEIQLTMALTGQLTGTTSSLSVDSQPMFQALAPMSEGLRLRLKGNQYFFTGATTVYPYAGFGLEICYEWGAGNRTGYEVTLGVDRVSNTQNTILPVNASFVLIFWP